MKNKYFIIKIILLSLLITFSLPVFAQTSQISDKSINSEEKKEMPQYLQDLRRFEVISLGSLPFVMLDSSLVYSGIKYVQNDFSSQYMPGFNQTYSQQEQLGLFITSISISVGIGITDFIVNLVKRNKKAKRQNISDTPITITPISQDSEAIKLDFPESLKQQQAKEDKNKEKN